MYHGCMCTLFAVVVIKYYVGWWRWLPGVSLPGICLCIVVVFWVAGAVVYYRQSDNRRYRGRLEPVDDRKIRTYLFKKIMTVLLAGFVSVILIWLCFLRLVTWPKRRWRRMLRR